MRPMLKVEIFDADGNCVEHHIGPADTITDAELADAVRMIESGTLASIATFLAKQHEN